MDIKAVPFSSSSPPVCFVLYVPSVMLQPKTQTFLLLSPHVGKKVHHQNCLKTGGSSNSSPQPVSNNFHEEEQQNAKWSGLSRYVCSFTAFHIGGPNKGVHYTPSGFRDQCPLRGLWLLTCHITNIILIFRAVGGKIWAWRLWNGRPSRRWVWLLLILHVFRCIMSLLITVQIMISCILFWDSR